MKTGQGLAEYAIAQLGRPYWWGCFGQRADGALYTQKKAQYPGYYTAADFTSQYGQKVHDCCGLIKGYLWCDTADGSPKYNAAQDVAVEGLYGKCSRRGSITTLPEVPGVCVFMAGFGHVGVYIGNGEVVEAMGHAYGVVKTKLAGRGWAYWGMPEWIDYCGDATDSSSNVSNLDTIGQTGSTDTFSPREIRYLRLGNTGEDVRALQNLLMARKYDVGPAGDDGIFGQKTEDALISAQTDAGLFPDGEFGPDSFDALWKYKKDDKK